MNSDPITFRRLTLLTLGGIVLFWLLQNFKTLLNTGSWVIGLFNPILLGFCIAFVLNVPMSFLERYAQKHIKKPFFNVLRRPLCIIISIIFILMMLAFVFILVVPELLRAFGVLAQMVPYVFNEALRLVQQWTAEHADSLPALEQWLSELTIDWASLGRSVLALITNGAGTLLDGTVQIASGIFGGMTQLMFSFILALYMLLGKETLLHQLRAVLRAVLPMPAVEKTEMVLTLSARTFAGFITGQCTEACILGTLCWLGMTLLRLPYAPMVGALIGFTALIPIVGAFIGTVIGAFMIGMVSPISALWFVIFLLTLQQIEGNLIYPRVMGSSVGLPGMWVLAGVTVGGAVSGVIGMLFAVPVTSILYTLARMETQRRLAAKHISHSSF